jgi:hypothetical protein
LSVELQGHAESTNYFRWIPWILWIQKRRISFEHPF